MAIRDDLSLAIESATCKIIAYRFTLENERKARMSRLMDKCLAAAAVAPRQSAKIEARADRIIAMEPDIERRTDDVFSPHENVLLEAEKGLDGLDAALRIMSNSPLESSGASLESHLNGSGASTEPQHEGAPIHE